MLPKAIIVRRLESAATAKRLGMPSLLIDNPDFIELLASLLFDLQPKSDKGIIVDGVSFDADQFALMEKRILAETERCAKIAESVESKFSGGTSAVAQWVAAGIRAPKEKT